jgi:putative phage-type endonuclease
MLTFPTREEWLQARKNTIGGSDASAVVGLNPYKSNVDLWLEKTGQIVPEDISDKPYVKFGTEAEPLMRELFKLDFPEFQVFYEENNLFLNDKYPWGHYSADGWLKDKNGRFGIFENKTTEILRSMQKEKWNQRLPDNYYVQLIHGFLITEAEFVVMKARLKSVIDGWPYIQIKHYPIERSEVESDIEFLQHSEKEFWRDVQNRTRPALLLPEF